MTNREQQAQQTYEHILKIAEQLLTSCSYDELSISDVCKESGISKGGFYHHFASKDQFISLLIGRQMQEHVYTHIEPLLGKKDAASLLHLYMQAGLDYLKNSPKDTLARCWLAISQNTELANSQLSLLSFELLQNILIQGIEDGCFQKDIDIIFYAQFIAATYSGILFHAVSFDDDALADDFAQKSMKLIRQMIF